MSIFVRSNCDRACKSCGTRLVATDREELLDFPLAECIEEVLRECLPRRLDLPDLCPSTAPGGVQERPLLFEDALLPIVRANHVKMLRPTEDHGNPAQSRHRPPLEADVVGASA
eukprot:CAMPEP_0117464724 /NCGR_PEP_ID=MMETSP0784-20121206/4252_1 /TAXON_ID=39447 /ORGANISM="" /LENGTH=113 /DNA_ID=CAMNT_0005258599 /DNA_START=240 /DNA_END=580 /DNA_ORIENTATION=-